MFHKALTFATAYAGLPVGTADGVQASFDPPPDVGVRGWSMGSEGFVASSGVAGSVCWCKGGVGVAGYEVVCLEWVCVSWAFSADVAVGGCCSDVLCAFAVVAFVVGSSCVAVGVVFVLAVWAACAVGGGCSAGEAGFGDHCGSPSQQLSLVLQFGQSHLCAVGL